MQYCARCKPNGFAYAYLPVSSYTKEMEEMKNMSRQEFIASLRRKAVPFRGQQLKYPLKEYEFDEKKLKNVQSQLEKLVAENYYLNK